MDVHNGITTAWERKANNGIDAYAKAGAEFHKVPMDHILEQVAFASLAKQAARWGAEAHVAATKLVKPKERKRRKATHRTAGLKRRRVNPPDSRLDDELPPAAVVAPPSRTSFVDPMKLFEHALQIAGVV